MRKSLILLGAATGAIAVLALHQVPVTATAADRQAIQKLLPGRPATPRSFDEEIALILHVQDRVLAASPEERGIAPGQPREIADLLRARHGACFDRSRAIETVLRHLGFRTRHAAMYSTHETGSALRSLATPDTVSHALTEVRTRRGWMAVDSKTRWAALTADHRPLDLAAIRRAPDRAWSARLEAPMPDIYGAAFTWLYGLYSRHGQFYPPYTPVPDVHWGELAHNF